MYVNSLKILSVLGPSPCNTPRGTSFTSREPFTASAGTTCAVMCTPYMSGTSSHHLSESPLPKHNTTIYRLQDSRCFSTKQFYFTIVTADDIETTAGIAICQQNQSY